jgi:tetratricopeptide (TPR) repeat protein
VFEIDPENAAAINNMGVAYFRMGEKEKAIQKYRIACEKGLGVACNNFKDVVGYLPSEEIDVLLIKSSECFTSGEYDEVITICSRVITLEPNNVTAFTHRCGAEANLGLLKEAKADCLRSIELNPDYATAYNNYGYVLEREGNIKEAAIYYEMSCGLGCKLSCKNQERLMATVD